MAKIKDSFDLVVIGGGVSGISSVYHLLKNGFKGNICLLEGRDRLGGRIFTSKTLFEEQKIEIGANWIHGIIDNPVYNILNQKQRVNPLTESSKTSAWNIQAKTKDGQDVASYWVLKVQNAYQNIIKRSTLYFESGNNDGTVSACNDSLGLFIQKKIDKWIENEVKNEPVLEVVKGMFDSLIKRETCISGASEMEDVSLQYYGAYEEFLGGNLTIPKGYYSLVEVLMDDIYSLCTTRDQFQIFKECKVTKIKWPGIDNSDCVKSACDLLITCVNGETFKCGHVIITIPLGCLKKEGRTLFEPTLPTYKLECIERMAFGTVDKIFFEYSSKGILSQIFTHNGVTTDEMFLLWENSDQQEWYSKIFSIFWVSDHCILLWVTGKEAHILERMSEDQVNTDVTEQLRLFFKNPKFPRADNVIVTRWGQDEFTLGSYSYISTKGSPQDIKHLAMPIYRNQSDSKPVIAFAGEATHERFFSTVHGAFLSGQNVAQHFAN